MPHTNAEAAFARGISAPTTDLTPDALRVGPEARAVWRAVLTGSPGALRRLTQSTLRHVVYRLTRQGERSDPLECTARILVAAARAGYPEAALRRIPLLLEGLLDVLFAEPRRALAQVDREELRCEHEENRLALERHLGNLTPANIVAEIAACEAEMATQRERIALLRRELVCLDRAGREGRRAVM